MKVNNAKAVISIIKELNYILNRKQKGYMLWVLIVIIISSGMELIGVSALLPFIQAILTPEVLRQNEIVRRAANIFGVKNDTGLILLMGVVLILVYVLKNVYMLFSYYIQADFATRVSKELSTQMLRSYMKQPYSFFLDINSSEVIRGCSGDVFGVFTIIKHMCTIVAEVLASLAIGIYAFYTDVFTATGVIVLVLLLFIAMIYFFRPVMKRAGNRSRQAEAMKNKAMYQAVNGIKEIYVMQRKDSFIKKYEDAAEVDRKGQKVFLFAENCPDRIIEGICVSGLIGIVCIRLMLDVDMMGFIPKLAVFAVTAFKIMPSIGRITKRINDMVFYRPMIASVYGNMKEAEKYEKEIQEYNLEHGVNNEENSGVDFGQALTINNVFWKYKNQKKPVLIDAKLTIHKGESIAFIGTSGAGKTTLSDIILGLFHPGKGTVLMDGRDIFAMPRTWARIVGYVPQAVFLLDDTVRNNIAFGIEAGQIDDKQVWNALDKAQLKRFIEQLPEGLDTVVGERGIKFSGGQKQRIAIARALYNQPEILVLDEATAALDNETENAVMESIDALQGKITLIIVAHRLTTIRNCDKIYEVKNGVVVERNKTEVLEGIYEKPQKNN